MGDLRKGVTQHPRRNCYFCGSEGPIETHHIIPQRHSGSDDESNLVDLCPTCHERIERLYNDEFFGEVANAEVTDSIIVDGSREETREENMVYNIISRVEDEYEAGAPRNRIRAEIVQHDELDDTADYIDKLRRKAEIYEPHEGHFRTT